MKSYKDLLDILVYSYNRQKWMLRLDLLYWRDLSHIPIDRPIFMMGIKGGGLTLLGRILRRSPDVVSFSGNARYWSGADEMYLGMDPFLPLQLGSEERHVPDDTKFRFKDWAFASDIFLSRFRMDESDYDQASAERFKQAIRTAIKVNSRNPNGARFFDKSQLYTVKIPLLREILAGCNPKFIVFTRDPYAMCYRAFSKPTLATAAITPQQRLEVASSHWSNMFQIALDEREKGYNDVFIMKVEDFLADPEPHLKEVCQFVELPFTTKLLPQKDDVMPIGTLRRSRWYPMRPNLNDAWLSKLPAKDIGVIEERCDKVAQRLGYSAPQIS